MERPARARHPNNHVELTPDSHNPEHQPIKIDLARHILHIDGVAVRALIGGWAAHASEAGRTSLIFLPSEQDDNAEIS